MARKREAFDRALGRRCLGGLLLALVVAASPGFAQPEAEAGVTLGAAITTALEVFSEVEASRADVSAAEEEVGVAKKAYLPSGEIYAQWNRASRNNVYGLLLPGGMHPSISGPVIEETTSRSAWGSLASVVLRWDVYDFGARAADVDEAEALHGRAEAGLRATELDVALGVVDDFVAVVGAESAFAAAAATLERMKVFETGISVLVENELRAGADLSFARAELARARIETIRAEQVRDEARMSLSEWLGRAGDRVEIDASHLMDTAPESPRSTTLGEEPGEHPLLLFREADVEAAKARRESASRQYRPSLELLAAFYSRGTSAMLDGGFEGGSAGLWPDTSNWAAGLAISFPVFDFAETKQQTRVEEHRERAALARYQTVSDHLKAEQARARIRLESARKIAENVPAELAAARSLQTQSRARYDAGLADVIVVVEAERQLRRAETSNALAHLEVWRAAFALAATQGDLAPLLAQLR